MKKKRRIFKSLLSMILVVSMFASELTVLAAVPQKDLLAGESGDTEIEVQTNGDGWNPNSRMYFLKCTPYKIKKKQANSLADAETLLKQYLASTVNYKSNITDARNMYIYDSEVLHWEEAVSLLERPDQKWKYDAAGGIRDWIFDLGLSGGTVNTVNLINTCLAQYKSDKNLRPAALVSIQTIFGAIHDNHVYSGSDDYVCAWLQKLILGDTYTTKAEIPSGSAVFEDGELFQALLWYMSYVKLLPQSDYDNYAKNHNNGNGDYIFLIFSLEKEEAVGTNSTFQKATDWVPSGTYLEDTIMCNQYGLTFGTGATVDQAFANWAVGPESSENYIDLGWRTTTVKNSGIVNLRVLEKNKARYFELDGKYYFGRTYWGGGASKAVPGEYYFSVEASPKDRNANLSDSTAERADYYKIHLRQGSANINPKIDYVVNITATPVNTTPRSDSDYVWSVEGTGYNTSSQNGSTFQLTTSGPNIQKWCDGTWLPYLQVSSKNTNTSSGPAELIQKFKFFMTIRRKDTDEECSAIADTTASYNGWEVEYNPGSTVPTIGINYCNWLDTPPSSGEHIPWEFHTNADPVAYAEIVANQVGYAADGKTLASDWNVMEGIPSTENISIAGGGTYQMVDLGGYVHIYGTQLPASSLSTLNKDVGVEPSNYALKRLNEIHVVINDSWDDNKPCELSCPGHVILEKDNDIYCAGPDAPSVTCPVCKGTVSVVCSGEHQHTAKCYTFDSESNTNVLTCGEDAHDHKLKHSCHIKQVFHCDTGKITGTANGGVSTSSNGFGNGGPETIYGELQDDGQRYYLPNGLRFNWCYNDFTAETVGPMSTICDGYTTGAGCTHTKNYNFNHTHRVGYSFYVQEYIDIYAWKEITAGQVWLLSDMEITAVNENVVSKSAIGRSTTITSAENDLCRLPGVKYTTNDDWIKDDTTNIDRAHGRFICSPVTFMTASHLGGMFKTQKPCYGAVNDYSIAKNHDPYGDYYWGTGKDAGYLYTNSHYIIEVYADSKIGDYDGYKAKDYEVNDPTLISLINQSTKYRGQDPDIQATYKDKDEFIPGSTNGGKDLYLSQTGEGCPMTEQQLINQAINVANTFQYYNNKDNRVYTIGVMSDSFSINSHWNGNDYISLNNNALNLVNALYAVDDGIKLYDCPFTSVYEVHYRTHRSKYDRNTLATLANGWASYKCESYIPIIGYNGIPNIDPSLKYVNGIRSMPTSIDSEQAASYYVGYHGLTNKWLTTCFQDHTLANMAILSPDVSNPDLSNTWVGTKGDPVSQLTVSTTPEYFGNKIRYLVGPKTAFQNWCWWGGSYSDFINGTYEQYGNYHHDVDYKKEGYYNTYNYRYDNLDGILAVFTAIPNKYPSTAKYNTAKNGGPITDDGEYNAVTFNNPFVISNIDLVDIAPNGAYSEAVTVEAHWRKIDSWNVPSTESSDLMALSSVFRNRDTDGVNDGILCKTASYSSTYTNTDGKSGVINDIIIHNPISVDSVGIIGNGYGSYSLGVVDETGEDARVKDDGTLYSTIPETSKNNYVVLGNTFHIWFSDFGDFYDTKGDWTITGISDARGVGLFPSNTLASNVNTGEVYRGAGRKGYLNEMNTGIWVKERYVSFTVPVAYTDINGNYVSVSPGEIIKLSNVRGLTAGGGYGYTTKNLGDLVDGSYTGDLSWSSVTSDGSNLFHVSPKLNDVKSTDRYFKYGLDYEFTLLPSAMETVEAKCYFYTEAINDVDGEYRLAYNNAQRTAYEAATSVKYPQPFEVVGRIGNLAIEDTGDFRFSELFKQKTDPLSWMIEGIIHNVDLTKPYKIVATPKDILGNDCSKASVNHAQCSVTNYLIGSNYGYGKAGDWIKFPLTAPQNPVKEYWDQQLRFGYDVYLDVETMGNYYGINSPVSYMDDRGTKVKMYDNTLIEQGPMTPEEALTPGKDTREYVMDIYPEYYLFDPDNGRFYNINIYYGNPGGRTLFWAPIDKSNPNAVGKETPSDVTSLYIDLPSEAERRNATEAERILTLKTLPAVTSTSARQVSCFTGADFIGTSSHIRLDAFDRSFIGSNLIYGAIAPNGTDKLYELSTQKTHLAQHWLDLVQGMSGNYGTFTGAVNRGSSINDTDFAKQSQRWYFTLGTPSSTFVTYPIGSSSNQATIEQSHNNLVDDHPNGVVISFLDITVKGTVWTLKYQAPLNYNGTPSNPSDNPPNVWVDPDDPNNPSNPKNKPFPNFTSSVITVYDEHDRPVDEITPGPQPTVVYELEDTSADDWDTFGTH